MKKIEMIGFRSGKVVVVEEVEKKNGYRMWRYKCDCGKFGVASTGDLRSNAVKSCGCGRIGNHWISKSRGKTYEEMGRGPSPLTGKSYEQQGRRLQPCFGQKRSEATKENIRKGKTGKPYLMRRTSDSRESVKGLEWKKTIRIRDKECQHCGSLKNLQVHHIKNWDDFPELRFEVTNGILLCVPCHRREHLRMEKKLRASRIECLSILRQIRIKETSPELERIYQLLDNIEVREENERAIELGVDLTKVGQA